MKDPLSGQRPRPMSIPASLGPNTECSPAGPRRTGMVLTTTTIIQTTGFAALNEDATAMPGFDHSLKRKTPYGR